MTAGKDAGEAMRRTRCHRVAIRQSPVHRRDTKTLERLLTVLGA